VKLHLLLDHEGLLAQRRGHHRGQRHDVRVARTLRFDPGTVVVMDRGYVDYAWFGQLTTQEVFFVTRLKDNAVYEVVERRPPPERSPVRRDEVIRLTGVDAAAVRKPQNFLKHADRDPEGAIRFNALLSACLILYGVHFVHSLTGRQFAEGQVFRIWFFLRFPTAYHRN